MGTLYLVSTPIGNLEDVTVRAVRLILSAGCVACEDTRRTGQLIRQLILSYAHTLNFRVNANQRLVSYRDANEKSAVYNLIDMLQSGQDVVLVTDAGTPVISDPGYLLVREALKRNIQITAAPGPSSVITAAILSGLPVNTFTYLGFPPEKPGHRIQFLTGLKDSVQKTHVMLCAPHKLHTVLTDMQSVFGDLYVVVLRELTKVHEERITGTIHEVLPRIRNIKGEIVVVFRLPG